MSKMTMKKMSGVLFNVVLYSFLAICILSIFLTITSKKKSDDAVEIFGYEMRIVTTESMEKSEFTDVSAYKIKSIPVRSMVFVQTVPDDAAKAADWYRDLKVGDVLTFRYVYTTQITITHRITSIVENDDGGYTITLTGDNKASEDGALVQTINTAEPNSMNYVLGKVTGKSYLLGLIVSLLMQPVAMVLMIIVPCFVIIILEILKISRVLTEEKRKKIQADSEQKQKEIEELRRKLAELETTKTAASDNGGDDTSQEDKGGEE